MVQQQLRGLYVPSVSTAAIKLYPAKTFTYLIFCDIFYLLCYLKNLAQYFFIFDLRSEDPRLSIRSIEISPK